jgi:hypothetical protein
LKQIIKNYRNYEMIKTPKSKAVLQKVLLSFIDIGWFKNVDL